MHPAHTVNTIDVPAVAGASVRRFNNALAERNFSRLPLERLSNIFVFAEYIFIFVYVQVTL
ncbi:unnamed protein product [Pararhodospirillum photometricum DSM 122]|uniref:Uncharacterized protein n=1 Tax=Pararhodospirillum photometricum DSM 122 TaxID=1150469 RepID=H6SKA4_PARPM|nr:unnamed protein product [Pararhodospirillum photometricum DSM 122]